MAEEQNAAVVRRVVEEIFNQGQLEVADVVFAPEYVNHDGLIVDLVHGPEAIKLSVALYRMAFPNLEITIEDLVAQQDTVLLWWTARGTPSRAANAATAPGDALAGMTISRLAGGYVMETWTDWNQADVLTRLGLIPRMEAPGVERLGQPVS